MLVAIPLLLLACGSAGWLAYGTNPAVADSLGGLTLITLTRRVQWILLIAAIAPCLVLILRVAMGRNRVWWLLGLSLVVGLLFVRFAPSEKRPVRVLESSAMPTLKEVSLPTDEEFIVGMSYEGAAYAFGYRSLIRTPIVQVTDFDHRVIVVFSPFANSATALDVTREVRASDLEYVSSPGNSTLVYNRKYGQFIVGITGLTTTGESPTGVRGTIPTFRMPLAEWKRLHPESRLMVPTESDMSIEGVPRRPVYPPRLDDSSLPADTPVALIHTEPPAAMLIGGAWDAPVNTRAGKTPIVLWKSGGLLRAFDRTVDQDLFLTFHMSRDRAGKLRRADAQTKSAWSDDGVCTEGPLKGKRLVSVHVDDSVYWGVSREWFADLQLIRPETAP